MFKIYGSDAAEMALLGSIAFDCSRRAVDFPLCKRVGITKRQSVLVEEALAVPRECGRQSMPVRCMPIVSRTFRAKRIAKTSEMFFLPKDNHTAWHIFIHPPSARFRTHGFDFPQWFSAQLTSQWFFVRGSWFAACFALR